MKRMVGAGLTTVSLVIIITFTVFPVVVRAVSYTVGVKVGEWIKYGQYSVTWTGNGTEPSYITVEKKVDWARIDVESVGGTAVTLNATLHYNNGTQTSQSFSVDVTGAAGMSGFRLLIASNLKGGDPVTSQASSPMINETTTGMYAGASRNVNLIESTSVNENQTTTVKLYWDQSTGAMVEMYEKMPDGEFSIKATETNMWNADFVGTLYNNLIYIIAGIVILIVLTTAAVVLRRRKTPPPPPPPEPTTTNKKQE